MAKYRKHWFSNTSQQATQDRTRLLPSEDTGTGSHAVGQSQRMAAEGGARESPGGQTVGRALEGKRRKSQRFRRRSWVPLWSLGTKLICAKYLRLGTHSACGQTGWNRLHSHTQSRRALRSNRQQTGGVLRQRLLAGGLRQQHTKAVLHSPQQSLMASLNTIQRIPNDPVCTPTKSNTLRNTTKSSEQQHKIYCLRCNKNYQVRKGEKYDPQPEGKSQHSKCTPRMTDNGMNTEHVESGP